MIVGEEGICFVYDGGGDLNGIRAGAGQTRLAGAPPGG